MGSRKIYYLTDHNNQNCSTSYGHVVFYCENPYSDWKLEYYFTFSITSKSIQINEYLQESNWVATPLSFDLMQKGGRDMILCKPKASSDYTIECLIDEKKFLLGRLNPPQKSVTKNNYRNSDKIISQSRKSIWDTLVNRYGLTKPFSGEYDAISLTPSEIHRFTDADRSLEDNSFLLHGYYQYKHILLFRYFKDSYHYGIGVPGIFSKSENTVSKMFGFPDFKPYPANSEKRMMPRREAPSFGTFGYYTRRITFIES